MIRKRLGNQGWKQGRKGKLSHGKIRGFYRAALERTEEMKIDEKKISVTAWSRARRSARRRAPGPKG